MLPKKKKKTPSDLAENMYQLAKSLKPAKCGGTKCRYLEAQMKQ
jgi:hypothetical protein